MRIEPKEVFHQIQAHCMAKEGAVEDRPWAHFGWKVKGKLFAIGSENEAKFTLKSTLEKQSALILHPQIEVAAYVGRHGWVTIDVDSDDTLELAKGLIDESYDLVTKKRK